MTFPSFDIIDSRTAECWQAQLGEIRVESHMEQPHGRQDPWRWQCVMPTKAIRARSHLETCSVQSSPGSWIVQPLQGRLEPSRHLVLVECSPCMGGRMWPVSPLRGDTGMTWEHSSNPVSCLASTRWLDATDGVFAACLRFWRLGRRSARGAREGRFRGVISLLFFSRISA